MTSRRRLGDFGERVAARQLEAAGMLIVARQVRTASGEIDLVARDGTDLVFVEVRTRRAADGAAAESLTGRKLERMWQCAMEWCEANEEEPERARLDVVAIDLDNQGRVANMTHIRGVELA